jgi:quercetin dioxygenase-like cupin family protein
MRHLALAFLLIGIGCSSGSKQTTNPMPPDPGAGGMNTADPGAGTETPVAKKEEPPPPPPPDTGGFKLVAPSSLTYAPLDPNNKTGPEVAWVSGDAQQGGAAFLKLPPGTKPGLHTHTGDYHAIVISGAPRHWLPGQEKKAKPLAPGSYWFQPGNQPHGDECTGKDPCVLYLVFAGAFDFTATPKAKPGKPGKYSLVSRKNLKFKPMDPKQPAGPKLAIVSGDPKTGPVAFVIELPPGANAGLHSHTSEYHALVLDGAPAHWLPHEANEGQPLEPGTYFFQPGGYDHGDRCTSAEPCHAFVMMPKGLDFKPAAKQ